jgi:serine protease Do
MQSLIKSGKVVRGWLGVSIQDVTTDLAKQFGLPESKGALVSEVLPDSPASAAGLQSGDVVLAFNGKKIDSTGTLRNTVAATAIGSKAKVELWRDKKIVVAEVKITEQPKEVADSGDETASGDSKNTALAGVEARALTPDIARQLELPTGTGGVVVTAVAPGGAADAAGLQPGDVITEIGKQPVRNLADYKKLSAKLKRNESVLIRLIRNGGKLFIVVKP